MESTVEKKNRAALMIAALNQELAWSLEETKQLAYATAVYPLVPDAYPDMLLRNLIVCYHEDHELVEALRDKGHPEHDHAWQSWATQALAILRENGLNWSTDTATHGEDLVQVALTQLAAALPSFRYTSRFSTWAYSVITRSVQRHLRDLQARKRSGRPLSLDQHPELGARVDEASRPEGAAVASVLVVQIDEALADQPDHRLAQIFKLWAIAEMQPKQIARQFKLSTSRVRVLLTQARDVLRRHPALLAWREAESREPADEGPRNEK